mmetsp:Transcript_57672/g.100971  ORF Transcript_57672/g.100971 Transcript_57672/m.100971 type:complete len:243 (+) Transcript_57672:559-1287(+)
MPGEGGSFGLLWPVPLVASDPRPWAAAAAAAAARVAPPAAPERMPDRSAPQAVRRNSQSASSSKSMPTDEPWLPNSLSTSLSSKSQQSSSSFQRSLLQRGFQKLSVSTLRFGRGGCDGSCSRILLIFFSDADACRRRPSRASRSGSPELPWNASASSGEGGESGGGRSLLVLLSGAARAPLADQPAGGPLGGFPGSGPLTCFCGVLDVPLGGTMKRRSTEEALPELLLPRLVPVQERRGAPL